MMQKSKIHIGDIIGCIIILFVIYCIISQLYTNIKKSSNQSKLQKYCNSNPNNYIQDMEDQEKIQDLKKNIQSKFEEQKLYQ